MKILWFSVRWKLNIRENEKKMLNKIAILEKIYIKFKKMSRKCHFIFIFCSNFSFSIVFIWNSSLYFPNVKNERKKCSFFSLILKNIKNSNINKKKSCFSYLYFQRFSFVLNKMSWNVIFSAKIVFSLVKFRTIRD